MTECNCCLSVSLFLSVSLSLSLSQHVVVEFGPPRRWSVANNNAEDGARCAVVILFPLMRP